MAGTPGANWLQSLITTQSQASLSRFCFDVRAEVLAADFLFALDEELHLQRQLADRFDPGFDALDVREHLAFVVGRAAGVDVAVADGRLERRADPLVERLGRLHVVVAVRRARPACPAPAATRRTPADGRRWRSVSVVRPMILNCAATQSAARRVSAFCRESALTLAIRSRSTKSRLNASRWLSMYLLTASISRSLPVMPDGRTI